MLWIQHRCNKSADLPLEADGVEIDLRSHAHQPGTLHLAHDPWTPGEDFHQWLKSYVQRSFKGPLILNTKEDGLETRCFELMQEFAVPSFFFLDTAFPTLVRWCLRERQTAFAVRLSSHEPLESLRIFCGKAQWVWVDCFDGIPLSKELVQLAAQDFKVCLVSPELQGQPPERIESFLSLVPYAAAVCTKVPQTWKAQLESRKI